MLFFFLVKPRPQPWWLSFVSLYIYPALIEMCLFSGTIGHVAHGKSTVVKAISGVQVIQLSLGSNTLILVCLELGFDDYMCCGWL